MPTAILEYGTVNDYDVTDDSGFLTSGVTIDASRETIRRKNLGTRAIGYVRSENPLLNLELSGTPIPTAGALTGVCAFGVGDALATANFTTGDSYFGIDADVTKLGMIDSMNLTSSDGEEESRVTISATFFPFVGASTI